VSESANHNNFYSADDIRRYLDGEMSAREMNALEKAALDDPFLQDAIDGYGKNTGHISEDVDELKTRLHERIRGENRDVVPLRRNTWWYAAAAVLIISAAGVILFLNNFSETGKTEIAKNEPLKQSPSLAETTAVFTTPPEPAQKPVAKARIRPEPDEPKPAAPAETETKEEKAATMLMESASPPQMAAPAEDSFIVHRKEEELMYAEKGKRAMLSKAKPVSKIGEEPHTFSGRIVDRNNKPVPGASILVLNNQLGVIADTLGRFNFSLNDSLAIVAVESEGYETANLTLNRNKANYDIRLREAQDLAKKQISRAANLPVSQPENAVPTTGWPAYQAYLDKNKKHPSMEADKHGEVIISFALDSTGKPQNLRVEKSLSKALDDEAMRLVKEGAAWKTLKEGNARTVLVVKF
jgi:TonB family protein